MLEIKKKKIMFVWEDTHTRVYKVQLLQRDRHEDTGLYVFIIYKIKVIINMLVSKCLTMERYGGAEANLHAFLTNVLVD